MSKNQLLDVLTREGVLIDVSVRYWRASKKLRPEDLGLDPDDVTESLISLGHKKLLPREALKPFALIEGRARSLVEAGTFPFLNGLGRFLPNARLGEVTGKLAGLETEFEQARRRFMADYGELRVGAAREWYDAARKLVSDPDRLVATIEASFPEPGRMARYFGFSTQLFQIRAPESLGLGLVSAADQEEIARARAKAAADAARQISEGVQSFVGDCVATLREETARLCDEMLVSMQSGKTGVHQKTLNRLVKFIDEFKTLNFAGDREMEAQLERARRELLGRSAEEYRDSGAARDRLKAGLRGLAGTARDLARQDAREVVERFGVMGRRKFNLAA